ncbi:MAG: tetratricopeptide repeat protein [Phycisphaeraceae bacterium]
MSFRTCFILIAALGLNLNVLASPLDDRIKSFNDATAVQDQAAVTQLLKTGVQENRSAEALATVQAWLNRNDLSSGEGLFYAAQAAERSGQWLDGLGYYQRLLNADKPNAEQAGQAAEATYRLLLNVIGDENAAYQFMRKDGNRIRSFGSAKRYDAWFLQQAQNRKDYVAMADRLAAIASQSKLGIHDDSLQWLCDSLEKFSKHSPAVYESVARLTGAKHLSERDKARLNWVATVMPYNLSLDKLRADNTPADPKLTDAPLAAATRLIKADPDHGPLLVAMGWGIEYDGGHTGNCVKRFSVERDRKLAQLIAAMPRMSANKRAELLAYPIAKGRVSFDPQTLRDQIVKAPNMLDSLSAVNVRLFNKERTTVEDAKQLAPLLGRSPHPDAALIRAIASSGSLEYSKIAEALFKEEAWRFDQPKPMIDLAWRNATTQDQDYKTVAQAYPDLGDAYKKLKAQIAKNADSNARRKAFNTLRKDLVSNAPRIPGALTLWDELFAQAPNEDTVFMVKSMTSDLSGDRPWLLKRALAKAGFGDKRAGKMPWQGVAHHNQFRYHRAPVQKSAPELIAHVRGLLSKQLQAGEVQPMLLGMWLHTADLKNDESKAFAKSLLASPAYKKLPEAYRTTMANPLYFGYAALPQDERLWSPRYVSESILNLPDKPNTKQVESAMAEATKRASASPVPVAIIGLDNVVTAEVWSEKTRQLVLTLFKDHSPLGDYPSKQGYEPLIKRLADEAREQKKWSQLEPYLSGLWHAAGSKDHHQYEGVGRLVRLSEAAFEADQISISLSIARIGLASEVGRSLSKSTNETYQQWAGRLSQVTGKSSIALGIIDIPVDELDPAYPIYKSQAEFAIGNLDAAWELYEKHADQVQPIIRQLTVPYCLWLLDRDIEARESDRAEALIKELTVWSRQASGTFSAVQEGELKIAYADAAFQKGALQTAKAWYRRVADSDEFKGTPLQYEAQLRSIRVDRAGRDFGTALAELDKLMLVRDTELRTRVHFARAEVFYDQERYADAFSEASTVLKREPSHPDALILLGQAQLEMRKLVDASEIELGVSRDQKLIVPGEVIKINLSDPALNISGVGADIEVEVWTKSGDRERVMLYQLGDDKTKFRAEIPTTLGKRQPGDKVLQILGRDQVRYGYSKRFREKMADLPADPDIVITVASDANLSASAGAFPPRKGERTLDLEELGVSSAQQALGTRQVRPGNPVYLRVNDPDQGKTDGIDEIAVSIETSNGDIIPRLILKETGPYSGEFEAMIPTGPAQALAYASESAPGRDANMVISAEAYPGWAGAVGSKAGQQLFTIDLNDNVALGKMKISSDPTQAPTHFVLQTSMNGKDWYSVTRYPADPAPWTGKPQLTGFPTYSRNGVAIPVSDATGRTVPEDWHQKMEIASAKSGINYAAFTLANFNDLNLELPSGGHPGYSVLIRYRAMFYQPSAAIRTFQLTGLPNDNKTMFLINGKPADENADKALTITRQLKPGLHTIEVWRHEGRSDLQKRKPVLLHNVDGQVDLQPMPDAMFDPATFPEPLQQTIAAPTSIKASGDQPGQIDIEFGNRSRARLVRLAIVGHKGPAPAINKITLTDNEGLKRLPVAEDYNDLRANGQLEVLPGDRITVRYEDDRVVSDRRKVQQRSLSVAYNTATIAASFLTYETNDLGERELVIEPIRRFKMDDNVGLVVNDPDLDQTPERDQIKLIVKSSNGGTVEVVALETGEHTGEFLGKVFPIVGTPSRDSEIQVAPGGTITAIYRDNENLDPGIPTDRVVTIEHALFKTPSMAVYDTISNTLAVPKRDASDMVDEDERGAEIVKPRQAMSFAYIDQSAGQKVKPKALIGSTLRFDVLASHMAFAPSSEVVAYVQTASGRRIHKASNNANATAPFDIRVPGTMRLQATPSRSAPIIAPDGYTLSGSAVPPDARPPLDEGRFAFAVPIMLDLTPSRSFATQDALTLPSSMIPDGLAVRPGDTVYIGFAYLDEQGKPKWLTATASLDSHAFIDVMNSRYRKDISSAFVGEKLFARVIAPDQDKTPERDIITVNLIAKSGVSVPYTLRETEVHSGVFKGSFGLTYANKPADAKLPSVALHGLPVKYGDTVEVSYANETGKPIAWDISINKGADGTVEPFTKQYGEGTVAVQTTFTLAECFFELAKHHRKMEEESLARRQMGHAQKLLSEAISTHRDEDLQAHAEYLLGNLAQEYADLSQNDASRKAMYQDALARFSKIPLDYPDSEFAPKAQFKKGLVYEKLGEVDIAVEEYVKLAYKYPDHELIPSVMSRLGSYFQSQGKVLKEQAESLEQDKNNAEAIGEALALREKMINEYRNAAQVFKKLQDRFPNDPLAGLAGLRSAQNFLRAGDYQDAIDGFQVVIDTETYDGKTVRSQAMFWAGISHERLSNPRAAYQLYRRTTFDFPDSIWAKQSRGRLADPAFARIIAEEQKARESMLEALKEQ